MMRAIWNGTVIARSDDTVVVEGNHYFTVESLDMQFFEPSEHHSVCGWKGTASYYDVVVDGERNPNGAWYYPEPSQAAANIRGRVAFWHGVRVEHDSDASPAGDRAGGSGGGGVMSRLRDRLAR